MMSTSSRKPVKTLITDFDNTLYDWFEIWYATFNTLLTGLVRETGLTKERLESEVRLIHQRHGTSEYSFLIEELPSLRERHPDRDLSVVYDDVISEAVAARRKVLRLYPGVMETLKEIRSHGTKIVTYTESQAFYTIRRVRWFDLDGVVDILFTPPDHQIPDSISLDKVRSHPADYYRLKKTEHRETPEGEDKPNPTLLLDIIRKCNSTPVDSIYVGDNLMKDVSMAQSAGVTDVYASYGSSQQKAEYELLRRVSHWPDAGVDRERSIHSGQENVHPTHTISTFSELLDIFEFVS